MKIIELEITIEWDNLFKQYWKIQNIVVVEEQHGDQTQAQSSTQRRQPQQQNRREM